MQNGQYKFVTYSFLNSCDFVEIIFFFFFYIQISNQNIRIILKQMYCLLYYHIFVDICTYGLLNITPGLEESNSESTNCVAQRSSEYGNL